MDQKHTILKQSIRKQLLFLIVSFLLCSPALAIGILDIFYFLTPELLWIDDALLVVLEFSFFVWAYVLFKKIRPSIADPKRRRRYLALSLTAHFIVVQAVALGLFVLNFHLFEPQYLHRSQKSPDKKKTAYLYNPGLFCGYIIYIRRAWSFTLEEGPRLDRSCISPDIPLITWSPDSERVWLMDLEGNALENNAPPFLLFGPWH